jgi:hypothetical protein
VIIECLACHLVTSYGTAQKKRISRISHPNNILYRIGRSCTGIVQSVLCRYEASRLWLSLLCYSYSYYPTPTIIILVELPLVPSVLPDKYLHEVSDNPNKTPILSFLSQFDWCYKRLHSSAEVWDRFFSPRRHDQDLMTLICFGSGPRKSPVVTIECEFDLHPSEPIRQTKKNSANSTFILQLVVRPSTL